MTRQQKAGIFITILVLILAVSFPVNAATIKSKSMPATSVYVNDSISLKRPVTDKNFKWKAASNQHYSLTAAGKLTGKKAGTAALSVTYKNIKYIYKITIKNKQYAAAAHAATITTKNMPSTNIYVGASKALTKPNITGFKWKTVNNAYYSVTTRGKVTGKKAGTASFSITYKNVKYVYKITVKNKPKFNCTNKTMSVGDKFELKIINGDNFNAAWNNSNTNVAGGHKGEVLACNPGTTIITANYGGVKMSCKVTVKQYNASLLRKTGPKADEKVLSAFEKLGFHLKFDCTVSYAGYFEARTKSITLSDNDDTIYHELGHFLAFISGNTDKNETFKTIYESEKNLFTGVRKAYATQNASEYFAESYRDYVLEPARLKKERPKTYKAIQTALGKVTDAQIEKIKKAYAVIWKDV